MEPATELPCNALRIRLDTALDAFRQRVYESNYAELKHVLEWVHTQFDPIDYDDHDDPVEAQLEARLDLVYEEYLHQRQYHPIARAEFVTLVDGANIDELAEPQIARHFVPNGTTTPPDPETFESRHQEVQSKVSAAAIAGEDACLPNEYRVIMSLAEAILPCGVSKASNVSTLCCCLQPLCSVAVPSLPELIDHLGLGSEDWIVYAGCITGTESYDNITACGLALCEKKLGGDGGDRRKAWRIS
ncbi:hypothetical protein B0A48_02930 [Cryoendolithus antarcticus]|uniref:Uncharacterized protein n=1 Tax=Cryoendolithus antarcticus TaxID=1507870 RepID=A0A1V8TLN2_9PEZI|nr:hypothetical protein B0A48_02930 [Cryoendolithus antarcticus]